MAIESRTLVSLSVILLAASASMTSIAAGQVEAPRLCVALARSELGSGADLSAPLRDAIVAALSEADAQAVALNSGDDASALMEIAQKNCTYTLFTRVQTRAGGGGLMHKMSNLRLPKTGGPRVEQSSSAAAEASPPPITLAAAEQSATRAGDTLSLEYRLMAPRSMSPAKSGKLEGRAQADGDDVLGPLVAQLAPVVIGAATTGASAAQRGAAQPDHASNDNARGRNGRGNANAAPQAMSCEQIAAASRGTVTVESCQKLMGVQKSYDSALADPSASRPGDDKMTCDQIAAEMKQQPIAAPDKAKAAEAQTAVEDYQKKLAEQQKEAEALQAKETAEMAAASRLAVLSNAAAAKAGEKIIAEQKAEGERMAKESAPKAERAITATADLGADVGQQVASNPRLAKLIQMANQKRCKIQ